MRLGGQVDFRYIRTLSSAGETGTPVGEGEDYGPCAAGSSCSGPGSSTSVRTTSNCGSTA